MIFSALIFLAMFFTTSINLIFVLALLLGISFSAAYPIIQGHHTQFMPRKDRGELSAIVFSSKNLAAALSPLVAGFIADAFGLNYVFLMGFIIFVGLVLFKGYCIKHK